MLRMTDDNGWLNTETGVSLCADDKGNIILSYKGDALELPFRLFLENWDLYLTEEEKQKAKELFCTIINKA